MAASLAQTLLSVAACAALALCGVPASAFAGENATAAEQAANDAAIQEEIDGLDNLEAGEDYVSDQILVTYSGQDSPEAVAVDGRTTVADALEAAKDDDMVVAAQPNYVYRLMDNSTDSSTGSSLTGESSSSYSVTALDDPATS